MTVKFKKIDPRSTIPSYAHQSDSGMDVYANESVSIKAHGIVTIRTGLAVELPEGYELQVRPRSSMSKNGIVAALGTVDSGYRGEIGVVLYNITDEDYLVFSGNRIAQFVICPVMHAEIEECNELSESDRGSNGFGSTGK